MLVSYEHSTHFAYHFLLNEREAALALCLKRLLVRVDQRLVLAQHLGDANTPA